MAIRYSNLDQTLKDRISNTPFIADRVVYVPARFAYNTLQAAANIALDETVTIGTNVFQFKAITTDSTRTGSLANASVPVVLTASGAMTWAAGDLLRLDNEIVKIYALVTAAPTTQAVVLRARCGTSAAVHAASSIFQAAAATTTQIPVGYNATLTPAVWVPALAAEINNALQGGQRATAKASTIYDPGTGTGSPSGSITITDAQRAGKVVAIVPTTVDAMFLRSAIGEVSVLATTETLAGANNVWVGGATMSGGAAATQLQNFSASRVPTAADVTYGFLQFYIPFTPRFVRVDAIITASGINKLWVGGWLYDTATKLLKIDNVGATKFAATDTVLVYAQQ